MMISNSAHGIHAPRHALPDRQLFRLIAAVTFPLFLVAALVAALWPHSASADATLQRWSVLKQARAASNSTIPFVFMG